MLLLLCGIPYNEKQCYFCLAEYPIMKKYPIFALRNFQKEEVTPKAHSGISAVYNNRQLIIIAI